MFAEPLPDDRGQAHTLEAFAAALLLVAGLIFATQATAVTPLSASTSNQHVENQVEIAAQDVLVTTEARGDLKDALLYYDDSFVGAEDGDAYVELMDEGHPLHYPLKEAFDDRRIAFNIDVSYPDPDGGVDETRMVDMGSPSDNAATASTRVTLYGDDRFGADDEYVLAENGTAEYFADPVGGSDTLYTVVEVRITAWQM